MVEICVLGLLVMLAMSEPSWSATSTTRPASRCPALRSIT